MPRERKWRAPGRVCRADVGCIALVAISLYSCVQSPRDAVVSHVCALGDQMGFPLEMFVHPDQISRALLCSICHELPMEPKQCRSGHIFCRECILRWLQQEQVCPMDRSQLRTEELSDCLVVKVRGMPVMMYVCLTLCTKWNAVAHIESARALLQPLRLG